MSRKFEDYQEMNFVLTALGKVLSNTELAFNRSLENTFESLRLLEADFRSDFCGTNEVTILSTNLRTESGILEKVGKSEN